MILEDEQNLAEQTPATPAETVSEEQPVQNEPQRVRPTRIKQEGIQPERRYTRDEVTDMMKKRVERSHNAFFKRYGVSDLKALDELFDKSNKFQSMQDEYGAIQLVNSNLLRENAFLKNNVDPMKYDDIIAHFKGKNIDFSEEELLKAITTHPEWLKKSNNVVTMTSLGSEAHVNPAETEDAKRRRIFGI